MKKILIYCVVAALFTAMISCMFVTGVAAQESGEKSVVQASGTTVQTHSVAYSDASVLTARTGPGVETYPTSTGVYQGYEYSVNLSTSEVTVTGYTGSGTALVFPETIDELPVVMIGEYALYDNQTVESVTIPGGIERIGQDAFGSCVSLKTVSVGNGVKYVDDYAFEYCENLTTLNLPDSVISVGYDVIEGTAYYNDTENWDGDFLFVDRHLIAAKEGLDGTVTVPYDTLTIAAETFSEQTNITRIILPDGLTGIGSYAFVWCTALEEINYPDSVRVIGENTLHGSAYAENQNNWDGAMFYNGKHLLRVEYGYSGLLLMHDDTISIAAGAFYEWYDNAVVVIPKSVQYIGRYTFYDGMSVSAIAYAGSEAQWNAIDNVPRLKTIPVYFHYQQSGMYGISVNTTDNTATVIGYVGDEKELIIPVTLNGYTVNAIGNSAFGNNTLLESVSFPDGVVTIGKAAFYGCENITKLVLPASLETIGDDAFNYLTSLETVNIPRGVTSIGNSAFYDCTVLATVTLPDTLRFIGEYAFAYNYALESVVIPQSVETLDGYAFNMCTNLASVSLPTNLKCVGSDVFDGTAFAENEENWQNGLLISGNVLLKGNTSGNIVVPYGVKTIAEFAMSYTSDVTSLDLPDTVQYIGEEAFSGFTELTTVRWSANLITIGDRAFAYTYALKKVHLPDKVTSVGSGAFSCGGVNTVYIPQSVTTIGEYAFELTDIYDIYYGGTPQEWEALPIGEGNASFDYANIHYSKADHETGVGVYEYNGDLYYADWLGRPLAGYVYVTQAGANGLIEPGYINTDAKGRLYHKEFVDLNGYLSYMEYGRPVTNAGVTEIDGALYYINYYGEVLRGEIWVMKTNDLTETGWHYTDGNGRFYDNEFGYANDNWCYFEGGRISTERGVVAIGEDLYYIGWNGTVQCGKIWVSAANGITDNGWHYTNESGRFYNNEFVHIDGKLYYMENGMPCDERGLTVIDGEMYYISWDGVVCTGRFWASVTNGLGNVGYYTAGENGVIQ